MDVTRLVSKQETMQDVVYNTLPVELLHSICLYSNIVFILGQNPNISYVPSWKQLFIKFTGSCNKRHTPLQPLTFVYTLENYTKLQILMEKLAEKTQTFRSKYNKSKYITETT